MSEYGVSRAAEPWFERSETAVVETESEPGTAGGEPVELAESAEAPESPEAADEAEPADMSDTSGPDDDDGELVEDYVDSDPQQWISGLIADLERAEQGIGSGPRDALMARIKLAQAYSELGDTVQAAPLAVANVAQAQRLFPSSEGMLRQLREFRDAACEAAGWTAAMMREPEEAEETAEEQPSELVARPWAEAAAEEAVAQRAMARETAAQEAVANETAAHEAAAHETPAEALESFAEEPGDAFTAPEPEIQQQAQPWPVADAVAQAWPAVEVGDDEEMLLGVEAEPVAVGESMGAVIHEFVRRAPEHDAAAWTAEQQSPVTSPSELAIPGPPEPEYAEEVEQTPPAAELAAFEEIIRLRYELREAHRTIDRLKHVNRKLREALDFEAG